MDKINVLIVDDSLVIRGMLTTILEADPGIKVVGAVASAAEADAVIAQQLVDVLTLDIEMPGLSGMEYLPTLARRHLPTVMLSSQTPKGSEQAQEAISRGAFACFNKANAVRDATELLAQVKHAAEHREKQLLAASKPLPQTAKTEAAEKALANAIQQLVAQHGADLYRFVAERVGFAMLDHDMTAVGRWMAIAGRINDPRIAGKAS